jgi:phosphatidylserine/phosphatidylglycerophosphate/cardiolipin synthase-like enzyme
MAVEISNTQNGITIKLKAYNDCDDVHLCWRVLNANNEDTQINQCLGFKIERQRIKNEQWQPTEILRNRVGFEKESIDLNDPNQTSKPSSIRPFQRYDWTDYGANINEIVRYRVVAMGNLQNANLGVDELIEISDSGWTEKIEVNSNAGDGISVFFNRGTVMSQFVARKARKNNWSAVNIKEHISEIEEPLRLFLSGELRNALIRLLDSVIENTDYSIYAALYELSDEELINKLVLLKSRANIVLSDGSNSRQEDGHTVYVDGNEDSRKKLNDAGVNVYDRILKSKGLGHNKFFVIVDNKTDSPISAWTGSTNWSPTGLCTQLNNGILIENSEVAGIYYEQWKKLKDAGNDFPVTLVDSNSKSPNKVNNIDIWFTRVKKPSPADSLAIDISTLKELVDNAQKSILYVMFQPGLEPLKSIVNRRNDPNIYVRGVVSTLIASNRENFELSDNNAGSPYTLDLIQPEGIKNDFSWWVKEVTRGQFIPYNGRPGIGFAITHTKMIVIDAFSDNCKVITGSHNFSKSASIGNDENFIIIQNNKKLAEHYSVACMAIYNHYRWRAYVKDKFDKGEIIWSHLSDDPIWQTNYLKDSRLIKHLSTWC